MEQASAGHPGHERLRAYRDGLVQRAEADEVAVHLAACRECRDLMEGLPEDDGLVHLLRSLPPEMRTRAAGVCQDAASVPAEFVGHPKYEMLGLLGRGGMGIVFKARHKLLDRVVALKVIRRKLTARPGVIERFRREAKAAARLDHPNVVRVYDAEEAGERHFLVMECVEGVDLARLVLEKGPLPVDAACRYARQAVLGLQHAHERGLVHRDIKPSNLILTPEGVVKVLDFGLAGLLEEEEPPQKATEGEAETPDTSSLTVIAGHGMGTIDYVAPEQAVDVRLSDIRSDIYSLGATLYHLLAGKPPFDEGDGSKRVLAHLVRTPRPLSEVRKDVPEGVVRVLNRMMAKDSGQRFQTPAEVAEALKPFTSPTHSNRRRFLAGVVAAGAVLVGGTAWLWWRSSSPKLARQVRRFDAGGRPAQALALSDDDSLLLAGADDGQARLFRVGTGEVIRGWKAHQGWVLAAAFLPEGRAVSGGNDRTVKVWETTTGREALVLRGHTGTVTCLAVSPDGGRILSGSDDQTARLWDAGDGRQLAVLEGHGGPVQRVAFSADGRQAVSGGNDRLVRLWDLASGQQVRRFEGHTNVVTDAGFCPDGQVLSGGYDATTRLWDAASGQEVGRRDYPLRIARVFVRGDRLLAVCVDDSGDCRLYDAGSGEEVCRFPGHRAGVWAVAVSQDGGRAVTADQAGTVVLWDLPGTDER